MFDFDCCGPTINGIHEASHAVIMAACGCEFKYVDSWRGSVVGWRGLCPPHVNLEQKIRISRKQVSQSIDLIDLDIVMVLAGAVSESKYLKTKLELERFVFAEDLRSIVYRMRDILEVPYELHSPYLSGLVRVTQQLLDKKWEAVLNVATILDNDRSMQFEDVLKNAQPVFNLDTLREMVRESRPVEFSFSISG